MSGNKIMFCACNSGSAAEYQNKIYGNNNRVHTIGGEGASATFTCSCCGKSKTSDIKVKKK